MALPLSVDDFLAALDAAGAAGAAAADVGDPITVCPHAAQRTPLERALARAWVSAYLDHRPPAAGEVDYDDAPAGGWTEIGQEAAA